MASKKNHRWAWAMMWGMAWLLGGCAVTPVPLTPEDLEQRVQEDLTQLAEYQEPVSRPITLYEAMARALRFNLEARVQGLKEMVAHRQLDLAHYDLLPQLMADAGYAGRSNFSGASSQSLTTNQQSLESSTSAEKDIFSTNLTLSWDVLDFGLSYVRAQQASNDILIAEEDKRRIANRVIQEVRSAFWKALGAERVLGRLSFLDDWVSHALSEAQIIRARALETPLTSLQYERELLQAQQEIQQLHQDLSVSRIQLGELMNLEPGEPYELVQPKRIPPVSKMKESLEELESQALLNRPELRTIDYQKRINSKETKVALLELLPSLNVYLGGNYDSNSFLFNQNWLSYGAKISWNLMNAFRYPVRLQVIDAQKEVLDVQSLALTMTIMTQVHVAVAQYEAALEEVKLTQRYFDTQMQIAEHVQQSWSLNRLSEHMVIREKVQGLLAELRYEMALAKLEMAYANLLAAIGEDPFPVNLSDEEVEQLAQELQHRWEWLGQHATVSTLNQTPGVDSTLVPLPASTPIIMEETMAEPAVTPVLGSTAELAVTPESVSAPELEATPVLGPMTEPVATPVTGPTTEPATAPVADSTTEPAATPVSDPTTEPIVTPVSGLMTEPAATSVTDTTLEPAAMPVSDPTAESTVTPVSGLMTEPAATPVIGLTVEPTRTRAPEQMDEQEQVQEGGSEQP